MRLNTRSLHRTLTIFDENLRTSKQTFEYSEDDKRNLISIIFKRVAYLLDTTKPNDLKAIQMANLFLDVYNNYPPSVNLTSTIVKKYNINEKMFIYPIPIKRIMKLIDNIKISVEEQKGVSISLSHILMYIRWLGFNPLESLKIAINYRLGLKEQK